MLKQVEELFDLALLVMMLLVVVLYSMPLLYNTDRYVREAEATMLQDKNTGTASGVYANNYGDFDDSYSKVAAVLVTQVQDANMPAPRTIYAEGMELKLPLNRKDYSYECGQTTWMLLSAYDMDTRFQVNYCYTLDDRGIITDDYYAFERMVAP